MLCVEQNTPTAVTADVMGGSLHALPPAPAMGARLVQYKGTGRDNRSGKTQPTKESKAKGGGGWREEDGFDLRLN